MRGRSSLPRAVRQRSGLASALLGMRVGAQTAAGTALAVFQDAAAGTAPAAALDSAAARCR